MAIISKIRVMFLIETLEIRNPRLLINEKAITKVQNFKTKSKTILIYIRKSIGKVENSCEISASFFLSLFL